MRWQGECISEESVGLPRRWSEQLADYTKFTRNTIPVVFNEFVWPLGEKDTIVITVGAV